MQVEFAGGVLKFEKIIHDAHNFGKVEMAYCLGFVLPSVRLSMFTFEYICG